MNDAQLLQAIQPALQQRLVRVKCPEHEVSVVVGSAASAGQQVPMCCEKLVTAIRAALR